MSLNSRIDVGLKDVMAGEGEFVEDSHWRYCLILTIFIADGFFYSRFFIWKVSWGDGVENKVLYSHRNAIMIRIAFLSLSSQPDKHIKCVVYFTLGSRFGFSPRVV